MFISINDERWIIIDKGKPNDLIKKHGRKNMEEVFLKLNKRKI